MANMGDILITFEIEPIVKLVCLAKQCKYNAWALGSATCDLKHIVIDDQGACSMHEVEPKKDDA